MRQNQINLRPRSNPLSRFLRPVFEHKRIKSALGGLITIAGVISGLLVIQPDPFVVEASFQPEVVTIDFLPSLTVAEVLPDFTGVSQEFHFGHAGIDITAPLGSKIYPIKKGRVIEIGNTKWNYGRSVTLDHGDGVHTLYAHLGKIYVHEGEDVDIDQPVGEVGLTGKTTGPHLHLEIMKKENRVNPRPFLALNKKK